MSDYVNKLVTERARAWEQAKEILDRQARDGGRERSAEENEMFDRANADLDRLGKLIEETNRSITLEHENDTIRQAFAPLVTPAVDAARGAAEQSVLMRYFANPGDGIEIDFRSAVAARQMARNGASAEEIRNIYTDGNTSAGSLVVPTTFVQSLYQFIEASSTVRQLSQVMNTASGEAMTFPRVVTHGVGTQVIAQGTVIGGTSPVFGTMRLDAWKFGQLQRVSSEAATDIGFDLLGFIAQNIGRAVGRITDTAYVLGNGTTGPEGIVTAAGTGVKTGGSLIPLTVDNLIDLQHSVVDEYRNSPSAAFVMNDSTAGTLRKIRNGGGGTVGDFIWSPGSYYDGISALRRPDQLLGSPVYTDTNFAAQGSASRSVAFGDWSAFYIRDSGSFRLERSTERYFDSDEIAFRGLLRTDSGLIDTGAIRTTSQSV